MKEKVQYYNIKLDDNSTPFFELEDEPRNTSYIIFDSSNGKLYPNEILEVKVEDSTSGKGLIGMEEVTLSNLSIIDNKEAATKVNAAYKPIVLKETKSRFIKPKDANYAPFTKVVVKAILKWGKDVSLSQSDHSKKISLISYVNKLGESPVEKELSLNKCTELLNYYTLKLDVLFKEELLMEDN